MKIIACLLLVLFIFSAFFGICNGEVWFEGYDPQEPQEIRLNMKHIQPIVGPYTALSVCSLILSEVKPQIVNLTIIVSTAALFYQDGNFETWLSINDQEPEKLVGTLDSPGSAAGQVYKRQYTVNLSGLHDGAHLIKIRVAGDYYGPEGGNYDCDGSASVIIGQDKPTPTPIPNGEPQTIEQDMTAGAILAVASITVFLSMLFYFIKRK